MAETAEYFVVALRRMPVLRDIPCCSAPTVAEDGIIPDLALAIFSTDPDPPLEADLLDDCLTRELADGSSEIVKLEKLHLMAAIRHDDAPAVLRHVAGGTDLGLMGEGLRVASNHGSLAVVRELVAVGLSVNEVCPRSHLAPLHLAAGGGHSVVCKVLLNAMADVHKTVGGTTALEMAQMSGHIEAEDVIDRHIAACERNDYTGTPKYCVLPRVPPQLGEALMNGLPCAELPVSIPEDPCERIPPCHQIRSLSIAAI
mmetsp:Transcript_110420/g.311456  ORF Transcript_110420/g.311456 Transcript_110420/m.311456 type:complete len:257 (-) Transcript_110420:155-925(-)